MSGGLARLGAFLLCAAALFPIQSSMDALRSKRPSPLLYTPDRRLMKVVSCGHGPVIADVVWIQSINYVIEEFSSGTTHIAHLYDLFDTLTELDPHFVDAYVTGAVFLASIAQEPEKALGLLEKGAGHLQDDGQAVTDDPQHPGKLPLRHPDRWKLIDGIMSVHLTSFAGFSVTDVERQKEVRVGGRFLSYLAEHWPDMRQAHDWRTMGEKLKLAPLRMARHSWDPPLPTREHGTIGDWLYASMVIWQPRHDYSAEGSPIRRVAAKRIAEIKSTRQLLEVQDELEAFENAQPLPFTPGTIDRLLPPCTRFAMPKDPLGGGYFLTRPERSVSPDDAARLEGEMQRDVFDFFAAERRFPGSLEILDYWLGTQGRALPALPWGVDAFYSTRTGCVVLAGKIVAPAIDASLVERELERRVSDFRSTHDRWPASLDELERWVMTTKHSPLAIPPWVHVHYEPERGEVTTSFERP